MLKGQKYAKIPWWILIDGIEQIRFPFVSLLFPTSILIVIRHSDGHLHHRVRNSGRHQDTTGRKMLFRDHFISQLLNYYCIQVQDKNNVFESWLYCRIHRLYRFPCQTAPINRRLTYFWISDRGVHKLWVYNYHENILPFTLVHGRHRRSVRRKQ